MPSANNTQVAGVDTSHLQPSQSVVTDRTRLAAAAALQNKGFFQRTIRNLLSSTVAELIDSEINFYLYQEHSDHEHHDGAFIPLFTSATAGKPQDDDMQLDFQNIKRFYNVINKKRFLEKNLCFRLHFEQSTVKAKAISDEDIDLSIESTSCQLINPCFLEK